MRRASLTALAEQDLIDIWRHTVERWSEEQADAFLDAIGPAFQQLADHPASGADRDSVREGYRVRFVNSHAIYYRVTPSAVQVIRVLHARMDPQINL